MFNVLEKAVKMSRKDSKLEDVLKPGAVLTDGNYDAVLSDSLMKSLKEWDKNCSNSQQGKVVETSKQFAGNDYLLKKSERKEKK